MKVRICSKTFPILLDALHFSLTLIKKFVKFAKKSGA